MSVKLNESHYLYSMPSSSFFWEGVRRFYQILRGVRGTKQVKNPFSSEILLDFIKVVITAIIRPSPIIDC